jgi:hypothetical protein
VSSCGVHVVLVEDWKTWTFATFPVLWHIRMVVGLESFCCATTVKLQAILVNDLEKLCTAERIMC